MSPRAVTFQTVMSGLFVALGLIIVARGVIESAPLTFTLMGILMVALGLYRLRLLRAANLRRR